MALEFGDLLTQHVWGIANLLPVRRCAWWHEGGTTYTSDDTQSSGIGDSSCKLGACCNVHASQKNWVLDLQEICESGLDLLWGGHDECGGVVESLGMAGVIGTEGSLPMLCGRTRNRVWRKQVS